MLESKLSHNLFSSLYWSYLPYWSSLNDFFIIDIRLILLCVVDYSKLTINFNKFINFFFTFTMVSNASYELDWQKFIVHWHHTASHRYTIDVIYTIEGRFDEEYIFFLALNWRAKNIAVITLMETDIFYILYRWIHCVIVEFVFYLPFKIPGNVDIMDHKITGQYPKHNVETGLFKWYLFLH